MSAKPHLIVKWLLLFVLFDSSAVAEYRDAVGWYELVEELGAETPDGTGIKVSLIESAVIRNYLPDRSNFDFIGKTFTVMSGDSGHSNHATVVGQRLFGNTMSMAGGIDQIDLYESVDWLLDGFLQVGQPLFPAIETSRIQNHSWAGSFDEDEFNVEAMRRLDYAIERDRFVAVVALRNDIFAVPPLLAHAYNAITVGRPSGEHSRGG
ncbi:MAG TPA: hypothetical protein VK041_06310, partial [Opitutales bacterium]|nr:hypothetical protein [Opitutales bacterium]